VMTLRVFKSTIESRQELDQKDKTILVRPFEYHDPLHEVRRQEMFEAIRVWILKRASS
jgi:hypothetical protein